MADSIERIAREMDEAAEAYAGHHSSGTFRRLATRLRALSPAGGDCPLGIECAKANPELWRCIREAASPQQEPGAVGGLVRWDLLPSYLIDHCEGDTISEEGLQHAVAAMLRDPKYSHSKPTPADESGAGLVGIASIPTGGDGATTRALFDARTVPPGTKLYASGQTLAGAGGELRQALQNAIALWGHRCKDCTQLVWLESAEKALATSAGTTGDDSEDAARYRCLRDKAFNASRSPLIVRPVMIGGRYIGNETLTGDEADAAVDAARRARGEG